MFTNLVCVGIHHVWLVETLHWGLIDVGMLHLLVGHWVGVRRVHLNWLVLLHVKWWGVRVLMHTLWRVKAILVHLLVVLVHLIRHLHVLIHTHLRLVLHLRIWVNHSHLLIWNVMMLHLLGLSVLYVFNSLLMWLHLINLFLILLN